MHKSNPWKTLSEKIILQNPWYAVRQDEVIRPDGNRGQYNVVVTPGASFIAAVDDELNVYLIGQWRYTSGEYSLEVPAGGLSDEHDDPLDAAKRELQEETGLSADSWQKLGEMYSANGLTNDKAHIFLARGLHQSGRHEQEEEGIQEVKKLPLATALAMARDGEITDAQTLSTLTLAALQLGVLQCNHPSA